MKEELRNRREECKALKVAGAEAHKVWQLLTAKQPTDWSEEEKAFMDDQKLPKNEAAWKSYLSDIHDSYEVAATKYNQVSIPTRWGENFCVVFNLKRLTHRN